jgi:hypothetical protein
MNTVLLLMRRKLFSGIALALSVLAIVSLAPASAEAGKAKKKATPAPHQTVISSVTATSVTVKEDTTTKTLAISAVTDITVNGQKATAADLKPGMIVSVTLTDPTRASRIIATSP